MWEGEILPTLTDYIRIPNKSPAFDPEWAAHGHMDKVVALFEAWAKAKLASIPGVKIDVVRLPKRTPLIFIEVPGTGDKAVLLYGHLDKQPEMVGWEEGLGPWEPVRKGDRLYGRGGADDGYAMFAAIAALLAMRAQNIAHARAVIMIEACEESGSPDLVHYVEHLSARIGEPSLVVCLDSGCGNYDQLWVTTSLRGLAAGTLQVRVLTEGVHSGDASGVVPSSFRIVRQLLSRLEDETSGEILPEVFYDHIPPEREAQAKEAAQVLGDDIYTKLPFAGATKPMNSDLGELVLNRTWRPQLAVIGMAGYPAPKDAGNVLLPVTEAKLSLRLPPSVDGATAAAQMKEILEKDPPYRADIHFESEGGQTGWNAPALAPWLSDSLNRASEAHFGKRPAFMGEGGSIPFMAMLGKRYPKTQFVVTGVLGPQSNAHGPNEFLDIPTAKKVSACIANILEDHAKA